MKQNSDKGGGSKITYDLYIIYGCTLMLGTTCALPGSWATAWLVCLEKELKNPCPIRKSKVIQLSGKSFSLGRLGIIDVKITLLICQLRFFESFVDMLDMR